MDFDKDKDLVELTEGNDPKFGKIQISKAVKVLSCLVVGLFLSTICLLSWAVSAQIQLNGLVPQRNGLRKYFAKN